jgi:glutathione S-transferase
MPTRDPRPPYITLLPSVDCDLGRWLMEHFNVPYDEHPHAPIFHILALKWYGFGKDEYPLLIDKPDFYPMIEKIFGLYEPQADAERALLPDDPGLAKQVMDAQHYFRYSMGGGTVNWAYFHLLPHKNLTWKSFTTGVPWWETLTVWLAYPAIKFLMFKGLGLTPDVAKKGLAAVRAGFDKVDGLLADGRTFLYADRLTFADLAFAASAAPMVLANGYAGYLPTIDEVPEAMRSVIQELRARPAGAYVQRMYDEYRIPLQKQAAHGGI